MRPWERHFISKTSVSLAQSDTGQERLKPLFPKNLSIPPVPVESLLDSALLKLQPTTANVYSLAVPRPSLLPAAYATPTFPFPLPGMLLMFLKIALFYGSYASGGGGGRGHNFPEIPFRICSLRLWPLCYGLCVCVCLPCYLLREPTHCPQTPLRHLT